MTEKEIIAGSDLLNKLAKKDFEGWVHCHPEPSEMFGEEQYIIVCVDCIKAQAKIEGITI